MLLMLAGMAAGGALTAYGKSKENEQAQKQLNLQRRYMAERERMLDAQQKMATRRAAGQMEGQAIQATEASRDAATGAMLAESEAKAAAGMSGTSGGSAYFQAGDIGVEGQRSILNVNKANDIGVRDIAMSAEEQQMGFGLQRSQLAMDNAQLDISAEELEYASSPLSWGLSMASGVLSGAQMGMEAQGMVDKMGSYSSAKKAVPGSGPSNVSNATPDLMRNYSAAPRNPSGPSQFSASDMTRGNSLPGFAGPYLPNPTGFGPSRSAWLGIPYVGGGPYRPNPFSILLGAK